MPVSKPDIPHVDVLLVGAGISGIDAAYRLKKRCPQKTWLILEARERIGGTWDLFRFPGVRSDSDIFTLGFPFRPWRTDQAIVSGSEIRDYVEASARDLGIFERVRFGAHVKEARWSSAAGRWTVTSDNGNFTCNFLYLATGYYDYDRGYRPHWPSEEQFGGRIVHPQFWPDDLDYSGKQVAVIGSGATAVTLVPALAETAAHVTMVQRSPSYIVAKPARDGLARLLQRIFPRRISAPLIRWKNILLTIFLYGRARRRPGRVAEWIRDQARRALPEGYPVERDFTPAYNPWDQRLCLIPDGDLFASISAGRVSIVTGTIERFTPDGLRLDNDEEVCADLIVTATGLVMKIGGGISLAVDGQAVRLPDAMIYKGMMLSGVPNLFISFGYANASWTLRSDLTARSACRLLRHMERRGLAVCRPKHDTRVAKRPALELNSGYVKRAEGLLPSQGDRQPWVVPQNYVHDLVAMSFSPVDEALEFVSKAELDHG